MAGKKKRAKKVARRKGKPKWKVTTAVVPTAHLVQFDQSDEIWHLTEDEARGTYVDSGCIVKLLPPYTATDEHIEAMRAHFHKLGALAVKVMPRATAPKHVATEEEASTLDADRTLRQVVMDRASRTQNVRDADALNAVLEEALTAGGL